MKSTPPPKVLSKPGFTKPKQQIGVVRKTSKDTIKAPTYFPESRCKSVFVSCSSPLQRHPFGVRWSEYNAALAKVESLMDAVPGSKQEEELELLSLLVERYEQDRHPIEAIRFGMDQEGLRQKDLAKCFSGKNRVSEVLNHKRPLSLGMIRSLHRGLGIPAHVLLQECTA